MGPGSDVAIKSADITLVKGDLRGIAPTEAQPWVASQPMIASAAMAFGPVFVIIECAPAAEGGTVKRGDEGEHFQTGGELPTCRRSPKMKIW